MTRKLSSLVACLLVTALAALPATAQFDENSRHGGFHLGVSGVGSTAAFGLQGETAINENVSVGAWFDTWGFDQSFGVGSSVIGWDVRYYAVAGTAAYHFQIEDQPELDLFAGGSVGYFVVQSTTSGTSGGVFSGSGSRLFFGAHGGARYWFKENIAGLAQLGIGASYLTLGLDFKL